MRKITIFTSLALSLLLMSSCNFFSGRGENNNEDDEKLSESVTYIVEAEEMNLEGYETDRDESRTFIKLSDSTGKAEFNFPYPSGNYDIDVNYLAESVGQNTYTMYIGDNQIVAWLGKDLDDQWHRLSEQQWHVPRNIQINEGDEIRIEALSENGSYVIFDNVEFTESYRQKSTQVSHSAVDESKKTSAPLVTPREDMMTIYPEEYENAIKNPLKGFRPGDTDHEYGTLIKYYFKWNELENQASDGVDKIRSACDARWLGIEKKNIKAIPRVYLEWPNRESGWPADMTTGDYTSDQFRQRVIALIKNLGQAWDNDPRVAFVEMGLIGQWGEMEFPDTKDEIKEAIAKQFNESFQNKLVMIRWPNTYMDHVYNFGYYWDSFAHHDQEYCGFHISKTSPKWQTAVIGGEVAYNWGSVNIQPGESPDISLKNPVHRDYVIDRIRRLHANHLGWIANYDHDDESVRAGAEKMQKALGYRFVIEEVSYPKIIPADSDFSVTFKVKNTGSSPFYYNWPVEISLLDPQTREIVWKKQCEDTDISKWLPGDEWDNDKNAYKIPPEIYTVNQTLNVTGLPDGEYILALAILDPAGNLPCARFAINNYYKGGRHPIGKVGINQAVESFSISGFDDLQSDQSLYYKKLTN